MLSLLSKLDANGIHNSLPFKVISRLFLWMQIKLSHASGKESMFLANWPKLV